MCANHYLPFYQARRVPKSVKQRMAFHRQGSCGVKFIKCRALWQGLGWQEQFRNGFKKCIKVIQISFSNSKIDIGEYSAQNL
jgi:hypothetical protein